MRASGGDAAGAGERRVSKLCRRQADRGVPRQALRRLVLQDEATVTSGGSMTGQWPLVPGPATGDLAGHDASWLTGQVIRAKGGTA